MSAQTMLIGNRPCRIYGEAHAEYLLLQMTGEHELQSMDDEVAAIAQSNRKYLFAAIPAESWNDALSPWEAPAVWGKQGFGSEAAAKWLCREYQKKGYIERVKRDLYVAISLENQQPIANRYVIASHISNDAAVSYHSAFEFYGYSNQVFYETQVTSESRFRDFEYDGVTYRRIAPRITGGITEINGTRVTTLERTVIDSVNLFEKIGGLEELLRCLALIPTLDEATLLACLAEYESGFLYQKTGYILSTFAGGLGLSDSFFAMCKSHLPKGKSYLSSESQGFIWHEEWKLYAPKNLMHTIDKGVTDYDAI